jgi:hypothetical protein
MDPRTASLPHRSHASWASLVVACALAACTESTERPDAGQQSCFIGSEGAAPELEILHRVMDGGFETTLSGASIQLVQPPQGGKMLFVGVRARNLDGCPLQITAALRDQCDDTVVSLERRPVVLEDDGSGWGVPVDPIELNNYSNLPACPRAGNIRNIQGEPYLLRVRAEDKAGREASAELMVTPVCGEPDRELCECECDVRFVLGESCDGPTDSGVAPGTCPVLGDAGTSSTSSPDAG